MIMRSVYRNKEIEYIGEECSGFVEQGTAQCPNGEDKE